MKKANTYPSKDSEVRKIMVERIISRISELGTNNSEVSTRTGHASGWLQDFLDGRSKWPDKHFMIDLAKALDCDFDYLLGNQEVIRIGGNHLLKEAEYVETFAPSSWSVIDGMFDLGLPVRKVLAAIEPGCWAISVPDDSNSPRFRVGEIVFTSSRRPLGRGAHVFIKTIHGRGAIGEITEINDAAVSLANVKEPIPRGDIVVIQKIIAVMEP